MRLFFYNDKTNHAIYFLHITINTQDHYILIHYELYLHFMQKITKLNLGGLPTLLPTVAYCFNVMLLCMYANRLSFRRK